MEAAHDGENDKGCEMHHPEECMEMKREAGKVAGAGYECVRGGLEAESGSVSSELSARWVELGKMHACCGEFKRCGQWERSG